MEGAGSSAHPSLGSWGAAEATGAEKQARASKTVPVALDLTP